MTRWDKWFGCAGCHFFASAFALVIFLLLAGFTQPIWAPFDACTIDGAEVSGRKFSVHWDCVVFRRYPVSFSHRLVHTESGMATPTTFRPGVTAKTGAFKLMTTRLLPENPRPGEWCYIVEAVVEYDLVTRARSYPHVCVVL